MPASKREPEKKDSGSGGDSPPGCLVVGIGSPAGGPEALGELLRALGPDTGMAFVLIRHPGPSQENLTGEPLGKHTGMDVVEVGGSCTIEPDRVYVVPPGKCARICDGGLALAEPAEDGMPIDHFFRSLAERYGGRCASIILTGTGGDGAQGTEAVKRAGGLTIAQDPETAGHDAMPGAIAAADAELTIPIAEMPDALADFAAQASGKHGAEGIRRLDESSPEDFKSILSLLRSETGYDFGSYKEGTLNRRIQRRMGLSQTGDISAYLGLLRREREELEALSADLLIGVTRFFRNRRAWEKLLDLAIRPLIGRKADGEAIRIWVPGCSTGEEVYTIAMLVSEEAEKQGKPIDLQLFATDLDPSAIAFARAGTYPESIGLDLSQERLDRHFVREGDGYRVNRKLRKSCIFAAQNLISDPPFSNLDIISCRNLLIYLQSPIQDQLIQLFHYSLAPCGVLLLGSSESTAKNEGLFEPVEKSCRIFRKKRGVAGAKGGHFPIVLGTGHRKAQPAARREEAAAPAEFGTVEFVRKVLLDEYAPASILIGSDHSIHYFHGPVAPYLDTPSGTPSTDVFATLIGPLEVKVRGLIRAAGEKGEKVRATTPPIGHGGKLCPIRISVEPLQPSPSTTLFLITFTDVERNGASASGAGPGASGEEPTKLQQLEYELLATREDLQNTIKEVEVSNEELKASNEEAMSVNEQLQSTNEQLETSREELHSLNEELTTVNCQLKGKLEELEASNNDLNNLLTSTRIATLFLDSELRVRRITPSCRELLNIIPADEGRPISDLSALAGDDDLMKDAHHVLGKLQPSEKEIHIEGEGWFLRRILPFRTAANEVDGVVIVFTDIDAVKRTYAMLESRERQQACVARLGQFALEHHELEELFDRATGMLVDALGVGFSKVLRLDPDRKSLSIVSGVGWDEKLIGEGKVPTGTDSQAGYTLQAKGPVVVTNLRDETRFHGPEVLIQHKVHSGLSVILGPSDEPWGVMGAHTVEDREFTEDDVNFFRAVAHILTEAIRRKEILGKLQESRERLMMAQEAADLGIHDYHVEENRVYWDQRSRDFWGVGPEEEITYQTFLGGIHEDDREKVHEEVGKLLDPDGSRHLQYEFRVISRKDKRVRWIAATARSLFRDGKPYRAVGTHMDVTEKRKYLEEQANWSERLEEQVIERTGLAEKRAEDLRQLASQITTAEERARRKVAQVIHDDIQQILIAAKMRLPHGKDELVTPDELKVVTDLLDRGLAQARSLVSELSPPVLHDGEFDKALAWLAAHMGKTHRLNVGLSTEGDLEGLEESLGTLLFNVVRELLFNVVKHSGTAEAKVAARVDGDTIEVEVRDSGKGFDVADRNSEQGGFGLFSIEERISAFGGTLDIESAPGKGSRFLIRLPLMRRNARSREIRQATTPGGKAPATASCRGERIRVMVVDDHEVVREGYVKILSGEAGLEVIATAGDGEEAVKLAHQHQPDLIIMDISMPRMNGIEATQMIKGDHKETVIIGLSMHEEGVLGASMRRAGASSYLQKDAAGSQLLGKIRELFPQLDQES